MKFSKRPSPRSLLCGLLYALAWIVPDWQVATATPYATCLTNSDGTVSFRLNEAADEVKVIGNSGTLTNSLGALARGLTVTDLTAAGMTGGLFQVEVFKMATGQVNTNSPTVPFNSPRGVAVNVRPASPAFGRVYVANSAAGTKGDGIFVFGADLSDTFGQGATARTGGITNFSTGGASSPYRLKVGRDDDQLYICDWSDLSGNLYVTDPDVSSTSFQYVLKQFTVTAIPPVGSNNVHGSVAAVEVAGSLGAGNLRLFTIDEDYQTDPASSAVSQLNSLWQYDVGAGPLPWSNAPNAKLLTPTINFVSQTMDLARGGNGYCYVLDNRSAGNEAGLFVVNSSGTLLFNSRDESVAEGFVADVLSNSMAVAVSPDGVYLAVISGFNVVTIVPLTNGIPNLHLRFRFTGFGSATSARGLAFDAADNLYVVSAGLGTLQSLSLGLRTTATSVSDGGFSLAFAPVPPTISQQTSNVTVFDHQSATLQIRAGGPQLLTYRWYLNGSPVSGTNFTGTNSDTLTIADVAANNGSTGAYRCDAQNPFGIAASSEATVTALTPPAVSIAYLRTLVDPATFNATNSNLRWQATGTVTTFTNLTSGDTSSYYLQDGTAGINIFVTRGHDFRPAQGDVVRFTGWLSSFNSTLELVADTNDLSTSFTILSHNSPLPSAKAIPFSITNSLAFCETNLEGSLVMLTNVFFGASAGTTISTTTNTTVIVTNANGEPFTLFFSPQDLDTAGQILPVSAAAVIGPLNQNLGNGVTPRNGGYQVAVTRFSDIRATPCLTLICPSNKTVSCDVAWSFDPPAATNSCYGSAPLVAVLSTTTNSAPCPTVITRTWSVTDQSGYSNTCSQTATAVQCIVVTCPAGGDLGCNPSPASIPNGCNFPLASVSYNCCGEGPSGPCSLVDSVVGCRQTRTITYRFNDQCGHQASCDQVFTWTENTNPPVLTCASNKVILPGTPWSFDAPTAMAACCGTNLTITILGTATNATECGTNVTRTWQATDCCTNRATCSQTVTLVDPTSPRVLSVHAVCSEGQITIAFSGAISAASATNTANYQITCSGVNVPVTRVLVSEDARIVTVFVTPPLSPGGGCTLFVHGLQDRCGFPIPATNVVLNCASESCAVGSSGTEYWLTFPGNYAPDEANQPVPKLFITGPVGTIVSVAMPGLPAPFTSSLVIPTVTTIPAGGSVTVTLPRDADLRNADDLVQNNAVHVVASQSVAVYALNKVHYSSDAYLGLSTRALGQSYVVMAYKNVFAGAPELYGSQFAVAAAQDNTTVTIVPSSTVGAHLAGVAFDVPMMRGQTYQLRDTDGGDLTGTTVHATRPIAVFGGHMCAGIPTSDVFFCDHLVEQMFPTNLGGTSFVAVPLANRLGGDTFRFLAMLDDTKVRVNGTVLATLDQSKFHETQLAGLSHITADKPIFVAQFANSSDFDGVVNADPFMVLIPPTNLFDSSYIVQTPLEDFASNFINVTAPNAATANTILLDGAPIPAQFTTIASSGFYGAQVPVGIGTHTLSSLNGLPFGIIVYGWAKFESYGYPGSICSTSQPPPGCVAPTISTQPRSQAVCQSNGVTFSVSADGTAPLNYEWYFNGSSLAGAIASSVGRYPALATHAGSYFVVLTNACGSVTSQVATLTVNTPLTLACPSSITTNICGSNVVVSYANPTITGGGAIRSCTPASGSVFPPGTTPVTCTATNACSTNACTFNVTVNNSLVATPGPGVVTLTWGIAGTLETTTNLNGPWFQIPNGLCPYAVPITGARAFFRVRP